MARRPLLLLLIVALVAACSGGGDDVALPSSTTVAPTSSTTSTTAAPTTTTSSTIVPLPAAPTDGPVRALVTPTGVVVAVTGGGPGAWRVNTPCDAAAVVAQGTPVHGATVVLDPGHGGIETGTTGPAGLVEGSSAAAEESKS